MKKIMLVAALVLGIFSTKLSANFPMSVGPYINYGAGINAAEVTTGLKNVVKFQNFADFGVTGYMPLMEETDIGALVNIGLHNYPLGIKLNGQQDADAIKLNYRVLAIGAQAYISGLVIGIEANMPTGGTQTINGHDNDINTDNPSLNTFVSFILGGQFLLLNDETGRLCVNLNASYSIGGLLEVNYDQIPGQHQGYNYHPATITLGLSYYFNLPGMGSN